ncbi:MAG: zinc-dependent metalloprotease, partial [Gemmataceae bacterium]|nr:zinc-dependent metalloprotease [Gemmataceae bacterium]
NAIEVVQQRDDEDFDPEDMNYNTFRRITTDSAFAIGPSRANPLTGEILDADILFDADFIRYWKHERQIHGPSGRMYEPISPIQAMDSGWGLNTDLLARSRGGWNDRERPQAFDPRMAAIQQGVCQCGSHTKMELGLASLAIGGLEFDLGQEKKDGKDPKKDDKNGKDGKDGKEPKKDDPKAKEREQELDRLIQQAVKEVVMHEVGHTLGLRHNFKASTMLPAAQLHDTKITREKGLVGSVMDYSPVNLAPKGVKQGDYFTTTIGPYDYWAIEYAYKPDANPDELKKIASRGAEPGLDYGTDEDTFLTADPNTNRFDLGADVLDFARSRVLAAEELLKTAATKVIDDGEGHQRVRVAFMMLLSEYGNGAYLMSKFVGGEHAHRDHRNDPKGRDPLVPVDAAKQREALKFLQEHILTDRPFDFPPELLRKLAVERWLHWGAGYSSTDFPVYDRVLGIQRLALNQLLSARTLQRVQANALKVDKAAKP